MNWRVEFDRQTAFVTGPKVEVRRRLAVCGDHSPIWVPRRQAWATSPAAASRLLDQIEGRQTVLIENTDQTELDLSETTPANVQVVQGGLW